MDVSCVRLKSVHLFFVKTPPAHRTPAVHSAQVRADIQLSSEPFPDVRMSDISLWECFSVCSGGCCGAFVLQQFGVTTCSPLIQMQNFTVCKRDLMCKGVLNFENLWRQSNNGGIVWEPESLEGLWNMYLFMETCRIRETLRAVEVLGRYRLFSFSFYMHWFLWTFLLLSCLFGI